MTISAGRIGVTDFAPKIRLFYFLHFVGVGIYYPYVVPYFRGLGLSGSEIGTAQMAAAIAAVPAALLWGMLADWLRSPSRALQLAIRAAFVAVAMLVMARTPRGITLVLFAHGLVVPAIVPLLDTVTVETVRSRPGASYARLRLFGSVGFIASAQTMGILLAARASGPGDRVVPLSYAMALLFFVVASSTLPISLRADGPRPRLTDLWALLRDKRLAFLLAAGAVHSASTASYQLFGLLVHDEGLSPAVTGAGMAFGVAAEVLVLFAFPALERRFSVSTLLGLSYAASAIRWLCVSRSHGAAALVLLQGFHGLTFGLYWAAVIKALAHLISPGLRATGQALYSAVTFSIGGAIGYRLAGFGYDRFGGAGPVYAWAGGVELLALVLILGLRSLRL